jgi:hypothetical protein
MNGQVKLERESDFQQMQYREIVGGIAVEEPPELIRHLGGEVVHVILFDGARKLGSATMNGEISFLV